MSDKPIENHLYSSSKRADYVIIVEKVGKKSNRIDFRYQGQLDNHDDNAMYFDDWEEGDYIDITDDITEETVSKYTVTIMVDDEEMGTASGGGVYEQDTVVQICAIPKEGYSFFKWDDANTSNPREIKVVKDISLTAFFAETPTPKFTITVISNDETQGSVKGSGTFDEGTVVEISATPEQGYSFKNWNDGIQTNPRNVSVEKDTIFTAFFEKEAITPDEGPVPDATSNDIEKQILLNRLLFQLEDSKKRNLLEKTKELRVKITGLANQFDIEKKKEIIEKVNKILESGISSDIFHSR